MNKKIKHLHSRCDLAGSGFAMIEIIVAAAIIGTSFIFILSVAQKSIYVARNSLHQTQAAFLLEEGAEASRIIRDGAWSNLSSLATGTAYTLCFSGTTWSLAVSCSSGQNPLSGSIFTRTLVFSAVNRDANYNIVTSGGTTYSGTLLVTVTVSLNESGIALSKTLPFYITDIFS